MGLAEKIGIAVAIVAAAAGMFYSGYNLGEYVGAEKQRINSYKESLDSSIVLGELCMGDKYLCNMFVKNFMREKIEMEKKR